MWKDQTILSKYYVGELLKISHWKDRAFDAFSSIILSFQPLSSMHDGRFSILFPLSFSLYFSRIRLS